MSMKNLRALASNILSEELGILEEGGKVTTSAFKSDNISSMPKLAKWMTQLANVVANATGENVYLHAIDDPRPQAKVLSDISVGLGVFVSGNWEGNSHLPYAVKYKTAEISVGAANDKSLSKKRMEAVRKALGGYDAHAKGHTPDGFSVKIPDDIGELPRKASKR